MSSQICGDAAGRRRGRVVDRARAAHLIPGAQASHEADEVQDVSQGDPGSDFGKVKARLGGGSQGRATRGRSLSEMRGWAHVGDGKESLPLGRCCRQIGRCRVQNSPTIRAIRSREHAC